MRVLLLSSCILLLLLGSDAFSVQTIWSGSSDANEVLAAHNRERGRARSGDIPSWPQATSSLVDLTYSNTLAQAAAVEAGRVSGGSCLFGHSPGLNAWENLAYNGVESASLTELTSGWANEQHCYTWSSGSCDSMCSACGHFTTMIRQSIISVGCAVVRDCPSGYSAKLACHYSAGGSDSGDNLYSCASSSCPTSTPEDTSSSCITAQGSWAAGTYQRTGYDGYGKARYSRTGSAGYIFWHKATWHVYSSASTSGGTWGWCTNNAYNPADCIWGGLISDMTSSECGGTSGGDDDDDDDGSSGSSCLSSTGFSYNGFNTEWTDTGVIRDSKTSYSSAAGSFYLYSYAGAYWIVGGSLDISNGYYDYCQGTDKNACSGTGNKYWQSGVSFTTGSCAAFGLDDEDEEGATTTTQQGLSAVSVVILLLGIVCMLIGVGLTVRSHFKSKVVVTVPKDEATVYQQDEIEIETELVETA